MIGPLYSGNNLPDTPLIFVDGGAKFKAGENGFTVGDGDSFSGSLDEELSPNKNYSDLAYTLSSIPAHFSDIHLLGFLGGRRDHEWINLGEGFTFLSNRTHATRVHFDDIATGITAGNWQLNIHSQFSLIALQHATVVLTGKCQYRLPDPTRISPLSSRGLSNKGHGQVDLETDEALFLVYPETNKQPG